MLDSVIVIGVVALLIAIAKVSIPAFQSEVGQMWLKLVMFFLAGAFNIVNGLAFSGNEITLSIVLGYFKDGLVLGAAASGIYGMGKDLTDSTVSNKRVKMACHLVIPARKVSVELIYGGIATAVLAFIGDMAAPFLGGLLAWISIPLILSGYLVGTASAAQQRATDQKAAEDAVTAGGVLVTRQILERLKYLDYYSGPAYGERGYKAALVRAVREVQIACNLPETGVPDEETQDVLFSKHVMPRAEDPFAGSDGPVEMG